MLLREFALEDLLEEIMVAIGELLAFRQTVFEVPLEVSEGGGSLDRPPGLGLLGGAVGNPLAHVLNQIFLDPQLRLGAVPFPEQLLIERQDVEVGGVRAPLLGMSDVADAHHLRQLLQQLFHRVGLHRVDPDVVRLSGDELEMGDQLLLDLAFFVEAPRRRLQLFELLAFAFEPFAAQGPQSGGPRVAFDDDVVLRLLRVLPHDDGIVREEGDGAEKLPWTVLGTLADIFRYLEGARPYHESTDHAKRWKERQLDDSLVVSEWQAREFAGPFAYWQSMDGPWMPVFKVFWTEVRNTLGETKNIDAQNYWGGPRSSNLFNKPSLHILQADFFAFLKQKRLQLTSVDQIPEVVADWLEYVNPKYFARDWKLSGVKKDSVGTRRQWSKLWSDHREGGPLPAPGEFSKLGKS